MRCLTLAEEMTERGAICYFVTKPHVGNVINLIENKGYTCLSLPKINNISVNFKDEYESWLGCSQQEDSVQTLDILSNINVHLLIVDHYALDEVWENNFKKIGIKIAVIDDLANRKHNSDFLLDQNEGRTSHNYEKLIPRNCVALYGSQYSLLRKEFHRYRNISLKNTNRGKLKSILISIGGIDKDNVTSEVLNILSNCDLPNDCELTIIMGGKSPWLEQVKAISEKISWRTNIHVDTNEMALLLSQCDMAIGAAGSSAWERCALGVPTIMIVVADNQNVIAKNLSINNAAFVIDSVEKVKKDLAEWFNFINAHDGVLDKMSLSCSLITDGNGTYKVARELESLV